MEFTFCVVIAIMFILAFILAFRWSSLDFANRRIAHDESLVAPINEDWSDPEVDGPLKQLDTEFFNSENKLELIW